MPDFLSCITTVVVEPGWLGQVTLAQHAAPELTACLEAARGQDPTFVLRGGGVHFLFCAVCLLVTNSLFCLLWVVSVS